LFFAGAFSAEDFIRERDFDRSSVFFPPDAFCRPAADRLADAPVEVFFLFFELMEIGLRSFFIVSDRSRRCAAARRDWLPQSFCVRPVRASD
jgi:hypothetical protein